ncbi:MAG: hypothetical protein ACRD44_09875 [Bryobacteraceae bacterium]
MKLRDRARQGLAPLKPGAAPEQILKHREALAMRLQQIRPDARRGDVLGPETQAHIREIVRSEMKGKQGKPVKAAVAEGNPKMETPARPVPVKVNARYPAAAPVSTVPPTLLLRLPDLPEDIEYHFVGRDLVLLDTAARIIVDFIPNAMP